MTDAGARWRALGGAVATPAWTRIDALALGLVALAGYWLANNGEFMFFDYHLHLAVAFLDGRLHIANPPSWLTEFAYANGKPYVYFDPFPAILLMPLAALRGLEVNIARVSIALGALNVAFMRVALGALGVGRRTANWCTVLFAFGTVHLFAAQYGNTWLLAHLCAVAALALAWIEAAGPANPLLLGLFSAIAATSRSPALLGCPVFLVIALRRRPGWGTVVRFALPLVATGILMAVYNYARFGEWTNNGYLLANQALLRPEHGSFSWRYIARNLYVYFVRIPEIHGEPPYLVLTDYGISLLATTPAIVLLARPGWSPRAPDAPLVGRLAIAACAAVLFLYLCYFWDGWRQFGCRYTLDFTPFLIVALALRNDDRPGLWRWPLPVLVIASVAVNAWGAWWWRAHRW
ncbi:MAG TPA: hypothetical protein VFD92_11910 [Candidatus Binatia bacterium]|nr:hypothetical protein [Candidatus Binatia bacterium]